MRLKSLLIGFAAVFILAAAYLLALAWRQSHPLRASPEADAVVAAADFRNAGKLSRERVGNMKAEALKGLQSIVWAMENPRAVNEAIETNMPPEQKERRARILQSLKDTSASSQP